MNKQSELVRSIASIPAFSTRKPGRLSADCRLASAVCLLLTAVCLLLLVGCRSDMQDQPKIKALRQSKVLDGVSARPIVEGTIPRGFLKADTHLFTGKKTAIGGVTAEDVDTFPFPITKEILSRGQDRYQIFCAACHGMTGNGDGMIVRRGFKRPPAYSAAGLPEKPVGHYFDVITNGWAAMPSYSDKLTVEDRWAVIAYVRALQRSQLDKSAAAQPAATTTKNANQSGGHQ
jgi:mono/diheme cytochrome c family protein